MTGTAWLITLGATFLVSLLVGRFFKSPYPNGTAVVLGIGVVIGGIGFMITCLPNPSGQAIATPEDVRHMVTLVWTFLIGMFVGSITNVTVEDAPKNEEKAKQEDK
jgi:hypothetical protein